MSLAEEFDQALHCTIIHAMMRGLTHAVDEIGLHRDQCRDNVAACSIYKAWKVGGIEEALRQAGR